MTSILAVLFWLFTQQPPGAIEGTAVRAGTGQAIPKLTIELWPTALTGNTDSYGKFSFPSVEPGTYTLFVEANGIRNRMPITILSGQKQSGIFLKINLAPAISGTIFDNNGERTAGVRVQAFQLRYTAYGRRMRAVASTLTNDRGEYRLSRLHPGEYYVGASHSENDRRLGKAELKLTPNLSNPDEGLPPMYFGGSFNPYEAVKVNLGKDLDNANVDIFLKEGRRFSVSGQIIQGCARIGVVAEGGSLNAETDFPTVYCDFFTIKGLAPGVYFLIGMADGWSSEPVRFSVLSQDARDIKVTLIRAVGVSGQASQEGQRLIGGGGPRGRGNAVLQDLDWGDTQVILARNSRDFEWRLSGKIFPDGSFLVPNVGPGAYDVLVDPLPERQYLRSIRGGARDLLVNPLLIGAEAPPYLNVVLGSTGGVVSGVAVDRQGKPASGAVILLTPNRSAREDAFKAAWADGQGKFRIEGVSPGLYTALAFEDVSPESRFALAFDSLVRPRFIGRGSMIQMGESASAELRLTVIPAAETDGVLR